MHRPAAEAKSLLAVKLSRAAVSANARRMGRRHSGRRLVAAAEADCRAAGIRYLTVRTLAACHPDPCYARTRAFYAAIGFLPLEVLPRLWNADNPCLILLMVLEQTRG